jgi:hypothetical protein
MANILMYSLVEQFYKFNLVNLGSIPIITMGQPTSQKATVWSFFILPVVVTVYVHACY